MQWLGPWLTDNQFQQSVSAVCAHPANLFGRSVLSISPELFVCGQSGFLTTSINVEVHRRGSIIYLFCSLTTIYILSVLN